MQSPTRSRFRCSSPPLWVFAAALVVTLAEGLAAQVPRAPSGIFVAAPAPITSNPLPAVRQYDWQTYTGVPGGIPNRTTICNTIGPTNSAATISNAAAACGSGTVLKLNPGTYNLDGEVAINNSGVTLRGSGADQTILSRPGGSNVIGSAGGGKLDALINVTGGGAKGTFTLTTASCSGFNVVGTVLELDMPPTAFLMGPDTSPLSRASQMNLVTAVTGCTFTVRNPWYTDWTAAAGARVKYYYLNMKSGIGIEDLKIEHVGGMANSRFWYCRDCWIKGVESACISCPSNTSGFHWLVIGTLNFEFRDNYTHHGGTVPNNSGLNLYGDRTWGGPDSNFKVENNIFNMLFPAVEINLSAGGGSLAYNYVAGGNGGGTNSLSWSLDDGHEPFNMYNLYEGNSTDQFGADNYFGGTAYAVSLRNYYTGYNPNYSAGGEAVWLDRFAYYYTFLGNVLGSALQAPTQYENCDGHYIYRTLGKPNLGNCDNTDATNHPVATTYPDPMVRNTLFRWGNYDYLTHATKFLTSEVPAGVPVPSSQTIPNSYLYAAAPAYFTTAGVPWPPIGPDKTGGNADADGKAYKIPAQKCWDSRGLTLTGGGTFSRAACYP